MLELSKTPDREVAIDLNGVDLENLVENIDEG